MGFTLSQWKAPAGTEQSPNKSVPYLYRAVAGALIILRFQVIYIGMFQGRPERRRQRRFGRITA